MDHFGYAIELFWGAFPRLIALTKTIRFMLRGEIQLAEAVMSDIVRRYPTRGRLHAILAGILFMQLRYEEAMRICKEGIALKRKPDSKLYTALGRSYSGLGQYESAKRAFQDALAASPFQSTAITSAYASSLIDSGEVSEAIQMLNSALKRCPRDTQLLSELARANYEDGHKPDAIKVARDLLAKKPKSLPLKSALISYLIESGCRDEARQLLREIEKTNPKQQYAKEWIAMVQLCLFEYARSAKTWEDILSSPKDIIRYPFHLASILDRQGRKKEAGSLYQVALESPIEPGFAIVNRGLALLKLGRYNEAAEIFEASIARWPHGFESAMILVNWSHTCLLKGDIEGALTKGKLACEEDPTLPGAASNLGDVFFIMDRFEEANEKYKRAIEIEPGYTDAYLGLAKIQIKQGNRPAAIEFLHQALGIEPLNQKSKNELQVLS